MAGFETAIECVAFLALNAPVAALLARLPFIGDFSEALKEKSPGYGGRGATSFSRMSGLAGAVIMTAFLWALANIVIYDAFSRIADIRPLVDGVQGVFLAAAAMFLPYGFNQIRSAFAARSGEATAIDKILEPTAPAKRSTLSVAVANLSSRIDDDAFAAAVAAIGVQVSRDFGPEWGVGATLTATRITLGDGAANLDAASNAIIYVGDAANDPTLGMDGVFGYHARTHANLPYAFVYLDVCAQYGEAWSCTLSHEVLEMLADPTAAITVTGPAPPGVGAAGQTVSYDLEVCDPTQSDTYLIDQVAVSNFVTRAWFALPGGSSATNFLNLPLGPFGARPKGYFQYEDSAGARMINGPAVDAQRLAARAVLGGHRRTAHRRAGFADRL